MKSIKLVNIKSTVPISVTGTACSLNCKHCGGHYLKHMIPISKANLIPSEAKSLLISGGSTLAGKVPILPHMNEIKKLKEKGYRLNFHVGLVDDEEALEISKIADAISFDFVGDDETIRYVYNLDKSVDDYVKTFEILKKYTNNVYPHITIGLNCGRVTHEFKAIDLLSRYKQKKVVFIVFIPTPATVFERCPAPSLKDIRDIFKYARSKFKCDLNLGCMYPKGKLRDEIGLAAAESGFNVVTQPSPLVVRTLKERGYSIIWSDECCVL